MSLHVLLAITTSIVRKKAHLPMFLSLLIPIGLIVVLNSIPSTGQLHDIIAPVEYSEKVLGIMRYSAGNCTLINIERGIIDEYGEVVVISSSNMSSELASFLNVISTKCPISEEKEIAASIPCDLFSTMNNTCSLNLTLGGRVVELNIVKIHENLDAVIIETNYFTSEPDYLCILNKSDLTMNALSIIEREIQGIIETWLYLLLIASAPMIYISLVKFIDKLIQEFKGLVVIGLENHRLVFCAIFSILLVSILVITTLVFISILSTYTVYFIISKITTALPPQIRALEITYYVFILIAMIACFSLISSRRVINELL
ncbi:MAG: hypothetical protein QXE81_03220 [Desulfurococcaceae archaeon]